MATSIQTVFVIVFENDNWSQILGNPSAPDDGPIGLIALSQAAKGGGWLRTIHSGPLPGRSRQRRGA